MPTGTQGTTARKIHQQVVNVICQDVNFNDAGIATGVATGKYLPAGAILSGTDVLITTTFNAQTTNVLTIGTNGTTANNIVATVTASAGGITVNLLPTAAALGKLAADAQLYVKYSQTGTAATQGAATFIVTYVSQIS
jgi:hypothetical protein